MAIVAAGTGASEEEQAVGEHYETEVNRGDVNMRALERKLNDRYQDGWRLAHVVSEAGNMIFIWERYK